MREGDTAIMNLEVGNELTLRGRVLLTRRPARPPQIAIVLCMQICQRLSVKDSSFDFFFSKSMSLKKIEDLYDDDKKKKKRFVKDFVYFSTCIEVFRIHKIFTYGKYLF